MRISFLGDLVDIQLNPKDPEMFTATWSDGGTVPEPLCMDIWERYEDEIREGSHFALNQIN